MPQAVVDPAEVRRFASNLKRFNADLQTGLASIHGQMVGLGDTWRDQEHGTPRAVRRKSCLGRYRGYQI